MQEDEKQRINRELIELLKELRVLLPGVQMLFAFMLILPFTGAFGRTSEIQRLVYFTAFLCATAATGLLIAPSAYHRLLFRQGDKDRLLWVGNRLAIVGTAFLGLAMTGVIFVVTNVLFTVGWAAAVAAVSAGWLAWLWFGLALRRRLRETPRSSGFDNSPRLRPGREERTAQPPGVTTRKGFAEKARSGRRDRVRRFAMKPGTVLLQEEHAHLLAHIEASRRGRRGGRMSNMKSTVRDVMTSTVVTVTHAAPFKEIVEKLAKYGISALPVIGPGGGVVGVISEADLMLKEERTPEMTRSLFEGRRHRRERTKMWGTVAGELMTSPAVTIGPEASVAEAARLMHEKHVKRLPVVDGNGALVGIVSGRDVLRVFLRPDEEIRDEIVHRVIRRILWLDPRAVHVHVRRGVITLEGEVKRKSMIPLITELVEGVEGVVAVEVRLGFRFDDTNVRAEGMDPWGVLAHGLRYP